MTKIKKLVLLAVLSMVVSTHSVFAQPATLSWDSNTEPEVIGYNIYYRTDSPTFPFNGTTLPDGVSPLYVNGVANNSLSIELPEDGKIYYFSATAVSENGTESGYSEIIASEWIPFLLTPSENQTVSTAPTFEWDQAPYGYNVTYELHYGTDSTLFQGAATIPPAKRDASDSKQDKTVIEKYFPHPFQSQISLFWVLPAALLMALLTARTKHSGKKMHLIKVGFCVGLLALQVACGGGSGDNSTISEIGGTSNPSTPPVAQSTTVITDITDTSYQVYDLEPNTTYYWKIVAVDETGYPYESTIQSFSTN